MRPRKNTQNPAVHPHLAHLAHPIGNELKGGNLLKAAQQYTVEGNLTTIEMGAVTKIKGVPKSTLGELTALSRTSKDMKQATESLQKLLDQGEPPLAPKQPRPVKQTTESSRNYATRFRDWVTGAYRKEKQNEWRLKVANAESQVREVSERMFNSMVQAKQTIEALPPNLASQLVAKNADVVLEAKKQAALPEQRKDSTIDNKMMKETAYELWQKALDAREAAYGKGARAEAKVAAKTEAKVEAKPTIEIESSYHSPVINNAFHSFENQSNELYFQMKEFRAMKAAGENVDSLKGEINAGMSKLNGQIAEFEKRLGQMKVGLNAEHQGVLKTLKETMTADAKELRTGPVAKSERKVAPEDVKGKIEIEAGPKAVRAEAGERVRAVQGERVKKVAPEDVKGKIERDYIEPDKIIRGEQGERVKLGGADRDKETAPAAMKATSSEVSSGRVDEKEYDMKDFKALNEFVTKQEEEINMMKQELEGLKEASNAGESFSADALKSNIAILETQMQVVTEAYKDKVHPDDMKGVEERIQKQSETLQDIKTDVTNLPESNASSPEPDGPSRRLS